MGSDDRRRFEEIMEEILELNDEALEIARAHGEGERARSYWYAHIRGAVDKERSGFLGGSMTDMARTLERIDPDPCSECGENMRHPDVSEGATMGVCAACERDLAWEGERA